MSDMNHDYDRHLVVGQIRTQVTQLRSETDFLFDVSNALADARGTFIPVDLHAYHTDRAADTLERAAEGLERTAAALRAIAGHVLYPSA